MDVPATRPEVTTTGIYGEELHHIRQRLARSDLCWCGDLTSRTQVLIVGPSSSAASRKLSVARLRGLPCVTSAWVTESGCAMECTDRFDIGHALAAKEVCTTGLHHLERSRVQAVCAVRGATYNALLTRHCGMLVAAAAALVFTAPAASAPGSANDKIRFARKHGIPIVPLEEFVLRYGTDPLSRPGREMPPLKGPSGLSRSSSKTYTDGGGEPRSDLSCGGAAGSPMGASGANEVLVCGSVRPSTLPARSATPTPGSSFAGGYGGGGVRDSREMGDLWGSTAESVLPSAVQPSLASLSAASQCMPTACAPSPPAMTWRPLADEFSDVVTYCSPPRRLTTQRHDVLSGMGITVTAQPTAFTTHILVLGDAVEECLFPRPGLQVVSWQWIAQCRLEQRRLSCLGFRVPCAFCPVITFTGLAPADRHTVVAALQRAGLPGEVQDALVLGSTNGGGGAARGAAGGATGSPIFLPRNTTHLVAPPSQLLASQKVAVLAQHHHQHASRSRHATASVAASPPCRLVGVEWVHRSIQQGHWLDAELFALTVPTPEAFVVAAASRAAVAPAVAPSAMPPRSSQPSQETLQARPGNSQQARVAVPPPCTAALFPASSSPVARCPPSPEASSAVAPDCPAPAPVTPTTAHDHNDRERAAVEGREEEEEAAMSQAQRASMAGPGRSGGASPAPSGPQRARGDDDEEAGGESPLAAAAVRSALQAIYSTPPQLSPAALDGRGVEGGVAVPVATQADEQPPQQLPLPSDAAQVSYTCLVTQYSPGFELLLGELEAGPPGAPAHARSAEAEAPPSDKGLQPVAPMQSFLATPPAVNAADWCVERRAFQRCTSAHAPASQSAPQRAMPPQLLGRALSDESQVVFYQMSLREEGSRGVAAAPPPMPAAPAEVTKVDHDAAAKAAAVPAEPQHSACAAAVFLVTKDVLKNDFDWDAFAACFPQVQRTNKPEECTHFITAKPSKTEQFLCCLAAGHWILTPAYVAACAQAGYLVAEAPHEWSTAVAASLGCRSSVASLVRGCRVQREAARLPFATWRARVCCSSAARAVSFLRVLRNGGCAALEAATPTEVLAAPAEGRGADQPPTSTELVLADEDVFTEGELEEYASRPESGRCPILRLEYLVQFLCAPDTLRAEMDLLHCVRARKRTRTEPTTTVEVD